jgi:hypothetical protein
METAYIHTQDKAGTPVESIVFEIPGRIFTYMLMNKFDRFPRQFQLNIIKRSQELLVKHGSEQDIRQFVSTFSNTINSLNKKRISLPSNSNLQSLPASIVNLENLAFINLKDSNPNIEIPDVLKEKLSDEGGGFYYVI